MKHSMRELSEREQWFISMIGKTVWRNNSCSCEVCQHVHKEGLLIQDRDQAIYCYDYEADTAGEKEPIKYFATKDERDHYEQSLSSSGR